jgi:hypothetical protein
MRIRDWWKTLRGQHRAEGRESRTPAQPERGLTADEWQAIYAPVRGSSLGAEAVTTFRQDMQAMRAAREERAMYQDPGYYAHLRESGQRDRAAEGLPRDRHAEDRLTLMEQRMQRLAALTYRGRDDDAFQQPVDRTDRIPPDDERGGR